MKQETAALIGIFIGLFSVAVVVATWGWKIGLPWLSRKRFSKSASWPISIEVTEVGLTPDISGRVFTLFVKARLRARLRVSSGEGAPEIHEGWIEVESRRAKTGSPVIGRPYSLPLHGEGVDWPFKLQGTIEYYFRRSPARAWAEAESYLDEIIDRKSETFTGELRLWASYPGHEQVYCVGKFEASASKLFSEAQQLMQWDAP